MGVSTTPVPNDGGVHPNFYTQRQSQQQQQPPFGQGMPQQNQQQPYYGMQQQQGYYVDTQQQRQEQEQQQPDPYGQQAQDPQVYYQKQAVGSQFANAQFPAEPGIGIQSLQLQLQQLPPQEPQYWTSGIFDCLHDPQSCIVTMFLPCVTYGQIAEILDLGTTTCSHSGLMYVILGCFAVPCLYSYTARTKLRAKYNLPEDPMNDLCTHVFSEPFALCQEYRELKNRGIDPALGWTGHQIKQNQEMMMAAPGMPSMSK